MKILDEVNLGRLISIVICAIENTTLFEISGVHLAFKNVQEKTFIRFL